MTLALLGGCAQTGHDPAWAASGSLYQHTLVVDETLGLREYAQDHPRRPRAIPRAVRALDLIQGAQERQTEFEFRTIQAEDSIKLDGARVYESQEIRVREAFNEAIVSWNIWCEGGWSALIEMRVGKADRWSEWLRVGYVGKQPGDEGATRIESAKDSVGSGRIDADYFVSDDAWERLQYRIIASPDSQDAPRGSSTPGESVGVEVERMAVCLTAARVRHPAELEEPRDGELGASNYHGTAFRWAAPFRSQKTSDDRLAGRLCSPTSVSMVAAYYGGDGSVERMSRRVWDGVNDLYGNWARNVQGAYECGVPGAVVRFSSWSDVERVMRHGTPLAASIVVEPGELRGSPYDSTAGHLIVLTGITPEGDFYASDPAVGVASKGQLTYRREDLARVWLSATKGTAYLLMPGVVSRRDAHRIDQTKERSP